MSTVNRSRTKSLSSNSRRVEMLAQEMAAHPGVNRQESVFGVAKGLTIFAVCLSYAISLFFLASLAQTICVIFRSNQKKSKTIVRKRLESRIEESRPMIVATSLETKMPRNASYRELAVVRQG